MAPLLLAFETATPAISVALLRGEELIAEERAAADRTGAESLLPAVHALLERQGTALEDVEAFAVSIGPGSFTGLRVGLATVKGLAYGTGRPVAPVPTLSALACAVPHGDGPVAAVLDARRGEVYAAVFADASPGPECPPLLAEGVYTADELAARLPLRARVVGEGVAVVAERLRDRLGPGLQLVPPPAGDARARHVGVLGARVLAAGEGVEARAMVPRYVRRAQAEVVRTGERYEAPEASGSSPRSL